MTTLYSNANAAPGTHVLAIGVGNYPYLIKKGAGALAQKPLGLGQLTSPPVSAKAFIDWCLAPLLNPDPQTIGLRNPDCPLASVEALISSDAGVTVTAPAGPAVPDRATLDNIQAAFDVWLQRIRSNDGNIGVFYFCGHGILVADHYLLAEDFGRSNERPWEKAFDISNTLRAVERDVKGSLYFFIDACKQISPEVALTLGANPLALKAVELKKPVIRASTSLIEATGEGKPAFGAEKEVARFTDALITAMSGYCGIQAGAKLTWEVDGELLASAIRKILENDNKNKAPSDQQVSGQRMDGKSTPLLKLATAPLVKVELNLSPEAKRSVALMFLQSWKGTRHEQQGAKGVFQLDVPRGFYSVGASAVARQFPDKLYEDQELSPPLYGLTIEV